MTNIYFTIPNYPGYGINKIGKVINLKTRCFLKSSKANNKQGHLRYKLYNNKVGKYFYIHRLVAHTFMGFDLNSKLCVLHKDDNPTNNSLRNLYIGTQVENMKDRYKNGNYKAKKHKLNNDTIKKILQYFKENLGNIKVSQMKKELNKLYGIDNNMYYKILKFNY